MKGLSIREPWATLILQGIKTIETRTWKTDYRGKLLLCCSLMDSENKKAKSDIAGKAFATAILKDVQPMTAEHERLACCAVYDGAYSWFLEDITAIEPVAIKGALSLFKIPEDIKLTPQLTKKR